MDYKQVLDERLPQFLEFQKTEFSGVLPANFEQKTVQYCHSLGTLVTFLTGLYYEFSYLLWPNLSNFETKRCCLWFGKHLGSQNTHCIWFIDWIG